LWSHQRIKRALTLYPVRHQRRFLAAQQGEQRNLLMNSVRGRTAAGANFFHQSPTVRWDLPAALTEIPSLT
jgi:hypothetical protein